jgi:hypothetical protein
MNHLIVDDSQAKCIVLLAGKYPKSAKRLITKELGEPVLKRFSRAEEVSPLESDPYDPPPGV